MEQSERKEALRKAAKDLEEVLHAIDLAEKAEEAENRLEEAEKQFEETTNAVYQLLERTTADQKGPTWKEKVFLIAVPVVGYVVLALAGFMLVLGFFGRNYIMGMTREAVMVEMLEKEPQLADDAMKALETHLLKADWTAPLRRERFHRE